METPCLTEIRDLEADSKAAIRPQHGREACAHADTREQVGLEDRIGIQELAVMPDVAPLGRCVEPIRHLLNALAAIVVERKAREAAALPEELLPIHQEGTIAVFIPTAPNPTSGALLFLPESAVLHTDMTTEEAFKVVLSGGVIAPENLKRVPVDAP